MAPLSNLLSEFVSRGTEYLPDLRPLLILAFVAVVFGSGGIPRSRREKWRLYTILLIVTISAFLIGLQAAVDTSITGISIWGMKAESVEFPLTPIVIAVYSIVGALIGPFAALLVGLAYGIGRYFWGSSNPYEIITFALMALFVGALLRQRIGGTAFNLLRVPLVAAPLGAMLLTTLIVFSTTLAMIADLGVLRALDQGLLLSLDQFPIHMVDALLGGLLATLALLLFGKLGSGWTPTISRVGRRLDTNIVTFYLLLAALIVPVITILTYNLPRQLAASELSNEMVYQSDLIATNIDQFLDKEKELLVEAGHQVAGYESDAIDQIKPFLSLLLTAGEFDNIFVISQDNSGPVAIIERAEDSGLTREEFSAVSTLLSDKSVQGESAEIIVSGDDYLSIVVPLNEPGRTVLIGRLALENLLAIAAASSGSLADSFVNVIDDAGRMLISTAEEQLMFPAQWPEGGQTVPVISITSSTKPPVLLESENSPDTFLSISSPVEGYPWRVIIAVPEESMVQQSLSNAGLLTAVLLISSVVAAFLLLFVIRSIRKPLTELEQATHQLANGNLDYPLDGASGDEIGRLVSAFREMRESVRRRQIAQQLLVELSQSAFRTLDLGAGIPQILEAAVQATGASSARFVLARSGHEKRLQFGQGPLNDKAAVIDTKILQLLQQENSFEINSPEQVSEALGIKSGSPVPGTIVAHRLLHPGGFDGGFWLAFKNPTTLESDQKQFLNALTQQMLIVLENARMFALNETGRQELEAILRSAADAVVVTDAAQRIRLVNEAAERFFGFHGNDVVGRNLADVPTLSPLADAVKKSGPGSDYIEVEVDNNRTLAVRVSELNGRDGAVVGRVTVLHDISRFKESDQAKTELIANISHDLRTPLSYIYNYATLIPTAGDLMPIQEKWLGKIVTGVNRMNELVDNLLDIRRLQSEKGLILNDIYIGDLLENVVQDWQPVAQSSGLELALTVEDNLPLVKADFEILSRSIRNLVSNAVKYAPDSGLVDINASHILGNIIISVKDRGPGVPPEDLDRIFDEFYRSESHMNNGVKGTGLGLALVKATAERHGGRVWCESQFGRGSTFIISLPAKEAYPFQNEETPVLEA